MPPIPHPPYPPPVRLKQTINLRWMSDGPAYKNTFMHLIHSDDFKIYRNRADVLRRQRCWSYAPNQLVFPNGRVRESTFAIFEFRPIGGESKISRMSTLLIINPMKTCQSFLTMQMQMQIHQNIERGTLWSLHPIHTLLPAFLVHFSQISAWRFQLLVNFFIMN